MPSIGNSGHDIVLLDTSTTVRRPKPPRRKIFLWKRADLQDIKDDLSDLASSIKGETDVNQAWDSVKCKIIQTMDSRVPSKITTFRHTNPWMNTQIKRAIRRKQRAHKKARETNTKRDRDRYKRLQKKVQFHVRKANKTYMQDTVSNESKDNSKKFRSLVKSKGQEFTGVAPLKNKDGFLQSNTQSRANILNDQFKSVITEEDLTNIPDKGTSTTPSMPEIKVGWKGVHKLLKNLKTHKATGPDSIPAFILKAAAN